MGNPLGLPGEVNIDAPNISLKTSLRQLPGDHPLSATIQGVFQSLGVEHPPALSIRLTSTIPVASGLGSGAAITIALIRGLSAFLGRPLPDEKVNEIAFLVEKLHHGTPSGIDNSVITYARPVYFVKGQTIQPIQVKVPFHLVIGDTGLPSPTAAAVSDVRQSWEQQSIRYETWFDSIGKLADQARQHIQDGQPDLLGPLMDENHSLLQSIGVSCPELDRLVETARQAGALGGKLAGGGRGGNMIALVHPETLESVQKALISAGAVRVFSTRVCDPA
jgi:mevalonate kinase